MSTHENCGLEGQESSKTFRILSYSMEIILQKWLMELFLWKKATVWRGYAIYGCPETTLTTLATVNIPWRKAEKNTPSSEFETMFQRELLLFLETKFPYNRVQYKPAVASVPQISSIRSTVSTWYRCVTDEHQVIAHIALYICVVYASCGKKWSLGFI